jgi:transcriptional regulator with XRE-family HTH domain
MRKARGIENRIRSRLQALGYWKGGRADVGRFCAEKGYLRQSIYAWLKGRVPQAEKLIRLSADLEVPPAWLLFGDSGIDGWMGAEVRQLLRPKIDGPDGPPSTPQAGQRQGARPRVRAAAP